MAYTKNASNSSLMLAEKAEEETLLPVRSASRSPDSSKRRFRWSFLLGLIFLVLCINLLVDAIKLHAAKLWTPTLTDIFPHSEDMCSICDCSANPSTLQQDRVISHPSKSLLPAFLQSTILNVQCLHIYAKDPVALGMLRRTSQTPDKMFQWDVSRLQPSLPTSFVFTKTSPTGKTGTLRPGYIQRHVHTMLKHESLVAANRTYFDGVASSDRQLIWIIVEDGLVVDEEVAAVLAKSRLNYIYWAYGPTRSYGNAQHNAALSMVHALTENYLGHGPILGVDDDAEIHPDLLQLIWKVKRVGLWPMGNLGPSGWEAPIVDEQGKIKEWAAGNSWRKYPVDNGAFTFNSSLLGSAALPGPAFWPTDVNGGESEFMEKVVASKDELEVLCLDCHVAWHNHPLGVGRE